MFSAAPAIDANTIDAKPGIQLFKNQADNDADTGHTLLILLTAPPDVLASSSLVTAHSSLTEASKEMCTKLNDAYTLYKDLDRAWTLPETATALGLMLGFNPHASNIDENGVPVWIDRLRFSAFYAAMIHEHMLDTVMAPLRGEFMQAAFKLLGPGGRAAALAMRSVNCHVAGSGSYQEMADIKAARTKAERARMRVLDALLDMDLIIDPRIAAASDYFKLVTSFAAQLSVAKDPFLLMGLRANLVSAIVDLKAHGEDPGAHPALRDKLTASLRAKILKLAGVAVAAPSPAEALAEYSSVGHPVNPLTMPPQQLHQAAGPLLGGQPAHHAVFQGAPPGAPRGTPPPHLCSSSPFGYTTPPPTAFDSYNIADSHAANHAARRQPATVTFANNHPAALVSPYGDHGLRYSPHAVPAHTPRPCRTIPAQNPHIIASCPKPGDFKDLPTDVQLIEMENSEDLVVTATTQGGQLAMRKKSATATTPPCNDAWELQTGSQRLGSWALAHGVWSIEVKNANDRFVDRIIDLHRKKSMPWATARKLENDFREAVHIGKIDSFADETAFVNLLTLSRSYAAASDGGGKKRGNADASDSTAENKKLKKELQAAKTATNAAKKALRNGGGGGGGTGGGKNPQPAAKTKTLKLTKDGDGNPICIDAQWGRCNRSSCKFANTHDFCAICGTKGHVAKDCPK